MQVRNFAIATVLTITTAVSAQSEALSQTFKNPTHPVLSEISAAPTGFNPATSQPMMAISSKPMSISREQTGFIHPPQVIRAATSALQGNVPSTYEFTLMVPVDAGQALKAVTITQATGLETIQFDTSQSKAFQGDRYASGPAIPLAIDSAIR